MAQETTETREQAPSVTHDITSVDFEEPVRVRKRPIFRRPAFLIGAALILLIAAVFGIRYWLYARAHESTDDAFIDGHIVQVSPKVSGYISKVYITDNQEVKEGDLV